MRQRWPCWLVLSLLRYRSIYRLLRNSVFKGGLVQHYGGNNARNRTFSVFDLFRNTRQHHAVKRNRNCLVRPVNTRAKSFPISSPIARFTDLTILFLDISISYSDILVNHCVTFALSISSFLSHRHHHHCQYHHIFFPRIFPPHG